MRIAYLNGGASVPSVQFRTPFFDRLREKGHRCDFLDSSPARYDSFRWLGWRGSKLMQRQVRRWHQNVISRRDYDAVVLETGLFHSSDGAIERQIREVTRRLVYEIDDAVFLLFPEKIKSLASLSDHVIAGNERLADWIRPYNPSISIIPTCIDETQYQSAEGSMVVCADERPAVPTVGWIGSAGNVRMLQVCAEALRDVASRVEFRFKVISGNHSTLDEIDLRGVNVEAVDIERVNTVQELNSLSVGVMPLPSDDPWMEYKCNAKMIQYMALGIPAIGSDLGFNRQIVEQGVNSLLAKNTPEWIDALERLLGGEKERQAMGGEARLTVAKRFTVASRLEEYENAILG